MTKHLKYKSHEKIENSKLQETAAIEGGKLMSGREVRIRKLKMKNKSDCV